MAIVRGLYGSSRDAITALLCVTIILTGLTAIWFIVAGLRVIVALSKAQDSFVATPMQRRVTFLFVTQGVVLLGWPIIFSIGFAPTIRYVTDQFFGWWVWFWIVPGLSLSIIVGVMTPRSLKDKGVELRTFFSQRTTPPTSDGKGVAGPVPRVGSLSRACVISRRRGQRRKRWRKER